MCPHCGNNDDNLLAVITYFTRRPMKNPRLSNLTTVMHCDKCGKEWVTNGKSINGDLHGRASGGTNPTGV